MSSFCSMSRLAEWFVLRNVTKHISLLYLCIFQKSIRKSYNKWQKLWEKLLFGQFCVSLPFPLLTIWEPMNEACVKQCYGFATLYSGKGELYTLFKIPIIFCHWLSEIKKKERGGSMHAVSNMFQIICFNESDYVTVHYYLVIVRKVLLEVHHDRCCSLVKLLCIYFCYFDLLNNG